MLGSQPKTATSVAVMSGALLINKAAAAVCASKSASKSKGCAFKPTRGRPRRGCSPQGAAAQSPAPGSQTFLTGDIGGTNARIQVWTVVGGEETLLFAKTYGTADHATFESVVREVYKESGVDEGSVDAACFAVAGPVADDKCNMTNLSWVIDGRALESTFGIASVKVINDFAAVGYGVLDLKEDEIVTLNGAVKDPEGPIAVLGPGTGLGEAMLFFNQQAGEYAVIPSEGSHADFAPRGETQRALLAYCEETLAGECEIEQVCCGSGIVRIYEFLKKHRDAGDKPELDPAGVTDAALDGTCELCREAVDIFLAILGAEAANLALKCLASGGVYIAGGIPPRLLSIIGNGGVLLDSFLHKQCRYTGVRAGFPLHIVLNDKIGLAGAKVYAMRQL